MKRPLGATLLSLLLIVLLSGIIAGCSSPAQPAQTPPLPDSAKSPAASVPPAPAASSPSSGATATVTLIARQFSFDPQTITVKQGTSVKLVVTSADVAHSIVVPGLGIDEFVPAGKTVEITFDATKAGTYEFFCGVYCGTGHRAMRGQIVVEP